MKSLSLTSINYDAIKEYVSAHGIKLLIIDFNGVLDNYTVQKVAFLRTLLGGERENHLPELLLFTEKAYMADRSATLEQSYERFLEGIGASLTDTERQLLANTRMASRMTDNARAFLDSLTVPFVIYTALSADQAVQAMGEVPYDVFTRDQFTEAKPSIANLTKIMNHHGVSPEETCVVGDGLIDDLLPATLIGAHTILVSPYAEILIQPQ